mmetsp:Transcript_31412/g.62044  ORF Transcript_31412/g.62044 Transcript_31412/m.62044 type:complete len:247 (+) Transcript_31412:124-864(+)
MLAIQVKKAGVDVPRCMHILQLAYAPFSLNGATAASTAACILTLFEPLLTVASLRLLPCLLWTPFFPTEAQWVSVTTLARKKGGERIRLRGSSCLQACWSSEEAIVRRATPPLGVGHQCIHLLGQSFVVLFLSFVISLQASLGQSVSRRQDMSGKTEVKGSGAIHIQSLACIRPPSSERVHGCGEGVVSSAIQPHRQADSERAREKLNQTDGGGGSLCFLLSIPLTLLAPIFVGRCLPACLSVCPQ